MKRTESAMREKDMMLPALVVLAVFFALSFTLVGKVLAQNSSDRLDAGGSSFGYVNTFGSDQTLGIARADTALGKVTLQATGSATVTVPLLTEVTVGTTGAPAAVDVFNTPSGDLGAYQFEVSYDTSVVFATDVLGGDFPFDAVTAVNITNPVTGAGIGVARWNHFQGGQVAVPGAINVASVVFEPVGQAGECTNLDITVIELVDNDGVAIPNTTSDGQVCLLAVAAEAVTDLVAAEDVDDAPGPLSTGVKPTIDLIRAIATGAALPLREIFSYEANITYPVSGAASAVATDCRLKSPFTFGPSDCSIGAGIVHLQATSGVTGSGVVAPIDPLAFVPLRLLGSNNPVSGLTTVNLNFVEIRDDLGDLIPQVSPPDSRTFLRGDALADGGVSIGDALFIAQHLVAPLLRPVGEGVGEVHPVNAGSVNHDTPGNDFISLADAILIAQFLVGNVDEFYNP